MKILTYRLPEFDKQVVKFNKKAIKWGLPQIEYTIVSQEVEERKEVIDQDHRGNPIYSTYHVEVTNLDIIGEIPKISGWSIHSRISPSDVKGQNFVFTAPQHSPLESLRTCPMFCEHCQTRRLKNTAYFIQHEDGRHMLVGSTCLKDFLPGVNVENLLSYMNDFVKTMNLDEENVPRGAYLYPTDSAILDALVSIKKYGFVSKTRAEETGHNPTSSDIDPGQDQRKGLYEGVDWEEMKSKVQVIKDHILSKSSEGNDFIYNVQLAMKSEYIGYKMFGYIAAAVNTWIKDLEKAAEQETEVMSNEWVGTVGQRVEFRGLKINRLSHSAGQWGTTFIYGFLDEAGNAYTWFGSKDIGDVGDIVNVKATIKAHDEYKNRKQTVITRVTEIK